MSTTKILLFLLIIHVYGLIIVQSLLDKEHDKHTEKYNNLLLIRNVIITIASVVTLVVLYLEFLQPYYNMYVEKQIAQRIVVVGNYEKSPENLSMFDKLCQKLFGIASDPRVNEQYIAMKQNQPESEVRNLCGNYARVKQA